MRSPGVIRLVVIIGVLVAAARAGSVIHESEEKDRAQEVRITRADMEERGYLVANRARDGPREGPARKRMDSVVPNSIIVVCDAGEVHSLASEYGFAVDDLPGLVLGSFILKGNGDVQALEKDARVRQVIPQSTMNNIVLK